MTLPTEAAHYQHDHVGKLVRMANQIAQYFDSQRSELRVPGVAEHIGQFWEKKMRRDIYAHIDAGGEGLHPTAIAALRQLRQSEKSTFL